MKCSWYDMILEEANDTCFKLKHTSRFHLVELLSFSNNIFIKLTVVFTVNLTINKLGSTWYIVCVAVFPLFKVPFLFFLCCKFYSIILFSLVILKTLLARMQFQHDQARLKHKLCSSVLGWQGASLKWNSPGTLSTFNITLDMISWKRSYLHTICISRSERLKASDKWFVCRSAWRYSRNWREKKNKACSWSVHQVPALFDCLRLFVVVLVGFSGDTSFFLKKSWNLDDSNNIDN